MNLAMTIYFIDIICAEHVFLVFIALLGSIAWGIGAAVALVSGTTKKGHYNYDEAEAFLLMYKSLWLPKTILVLIIIFLGLCPSKATGYKMLAAYGIESLVSNPEVQRLGGKSLDVINKAMDEYLKDDTKKP